MRPCDFLILVSILSVFGCSNGEVVKTDLSDAPSSYSSTKEGTPTMRLSPYLLLDGKCKEAMDFYHSIFGGDLTLTTVGDSPMKDGFPPQLHSRVVNAKLVSGAIEISASDWLHPSETPMNGNTVCLYLSGGTPQATIEQFSKLAEGANVTDPIADQPFGLYGALNDKFGVRWMVHAERK